MKIKIKNENEKVCFVIRVFELRAKERNLRNRQEEKRKRNWEAATDQFILHWQTSTILRSYV